MLLKNDPGYPGRLRTQMGMVSEALLNGSWDHPINLAIDNWDERVHTAFLPGAMIPPDKANIPIYGQSMKPWGIRWIGMDYGKTHAASAVWCYSDSDRLLLYRDHTEKGKQLTVFAHEVLDRCVDENGKREEITCVILSHELFADQGTVNSRASEIAKIFQKAGIPVIPSGRDPQGRLTFLREMTRTEKLVPGTILQGGELDFDYWEKEFRKNGSKAMARYLEITQGRANEVLPKMLVIQPSHGGVYGCPDIIRNWPLLMTKMEPNPDPWSLAEGQEDDSWDAAGYALAGWLGPGDRPVMDIYREKLAGKAPESPIAQELAMKMAAEEARLESGGAGEFQSYDTRKVPYE